MNKVHRAHIPVDRVLDAIKERNLVEVVAMGWDEDGKLYAASSSGRTEDILDLVRALEAFVRARAA